MSTCVEHRDGVTVLAVYGDVDLASAPDARKGCRWRRG